MSNVSRLWNPSWLRPINLWLALLRDLSLSFFLFLFLLHCLSFLLLCRFSLSLLLYINLVSVLYVVYIFCVSCLQVHGMGSSVGKWSVHDFCFWDCYNHSEGSSFTADVSLSLFSLSPKSQCRPWSQIQLVQPLPIQLLLNVLNASSISEIGSFIVLLQQVLV